MAPAPPPAPTPMTTRPHVQEAPAYELRPWGFLVLLGALFVIAAQVIALTEAFDEDSPGGKETAMITLSFAGNAVIGLALVTGGCFARGPFGGRVALLAVGAFLLTSSSPLSYLTLFGFGGGFF